MLLTRWWPHMLVLNKKPPECGHKNEGFHGLKVKPSIISSSLLLCLAVLLLVLPLGCDSAWWRSRCGCNRRPPHGHSPHHQPPPLRRPPARRTPPPHRQPPPRRTQPPHPRPPPTHHGMDNR
ncbi:hypothetical protein NP493_653g01039 [Ridgeia piscesae]|uniref:Uncharacterized protein n=1 Tax=Ridgeia piscesae TaxID=27915 RepID=A0AAD9NRA5_RIDPI|nr:hypothetical protein NP493_653g01039 [Ridgeia piscesae]